MATSAEIMKQMQKDHGKDIVTLGMKFLNVPRLPTGIFAFDLATGGGFPMAKMSIVFGPESSGKTNLAYKAMAMAQLIYPDKKAVMVDAEDGWDPEWASQLGVDVDNVIVVKPDYAEQAVDFVESFLYADDVSVVVLDSIPALITENESNSSAEKAVVGGNSAAVGKLVRKAVKALRTCQRDKKFAPALICINQIRHKIGVMFGDPETMPGGNSLRFASSLTVRIYGKNTMDKKIDPVLPAYKETSIILRKWKMPVLSVNAEYNMLMVTEDAGSVNDWNTVANYLKELDYLSKDKAGWVMFGETYKTLGDCKDHLYSNPDMLNEAKTTIIKELMDRKHIKPTSAVDEGDAEAEELDNAL